MEQLSFTDLIGQPQQAGRFSSSRPIPGTPAYKAEQELEAHRRMQTYLPKELFTDGWMLFKEVDRGQSKWVVWHSYTFLTTEPLISFQDAIEQAMHLATFYELLPTKLLEHQWNHNRSCFQKLPTFRHWYKHDPKTASRWLDEYHQRTNL